MSDGDILVEARGVSKKFSRSLKKSLLYGLKDVTAAMLGRAGERHDLRGDEFWAVKDVNFQLRRGECLGLIGHNGAGKSTLLKMLNGLIRPDEGEIVMRGRVGALIELGAGFNPILSGRENIYINGQVLGFSRKEIDDKLDAIIEFSEIGEFIDMPVQNYSSGMKVRLGFAVAAQMEPDVLIVDEVLAVGDMKFRIKCFNVMNKLLRNSAIVFVSHNMSQVTKISDKVLFLDHGKEEYLGSNLNYCVQAYFGSQKTKIESETAKGGIELKKYNVRIDFGIIEFDFVLASDRLIKGAVFQITIFDQEYRPISIVNSNFSGQNYTLNPDEDLRLKCQVDHLLSNGSYSCNLTIMSDRDLGSLPSILLQNAMVFNVDNRTHTTQVAVQLDGVWTKVL